MEHPDDNTFEEDERVEREAIAPLNPGEYLAYRVLREHHLTPPLTYEEIRDICNARGYPVIPKPDLEGRDAVCCCHPDYPSPVIFVKYENPFMLAHELKHAIEGENLEHGILYCMHWFSETEDEEEEANRFAAILTCNADVSLSPTYRADWDEPGPEEWFDGEAEL